MLPCAPTSVLYALHLQCGSFPLASRFRIPHCSLSVVIKYLERVLQDCVYTLALPPRVRNIALSGATHERWSEHNSQILAGHTIDA